MITQKSTPTTSTCTKSDYSISDVYILHHMSGWDKHKIVVDLGMFTVYI